MKQLVLDLIPTPQPTLANFVAGRNQEALAAAKAVLIDGQNGNQGSAGVIYLWGPRGSGKSHLIAALSNAGCSAQLINDDDAAPSAYAFDDVDRLDESAQHALFNLINRLQQTKGFLVASGCVAPRDLTLRRDLASRLGSGLVFQLQPLSEEERADALRVHARVRGFALREDVIGYLLRHARRDMASLMDILDALDRHSIETGREITLPLLREVSQPTLV